MSLENQRVYPNNHDAIIEARGITLRQHFSSMVLQGLVSDSENASSAEKIAKKRAYQ